MDGPIIQLPNTERLPPEVIPYLNVVQLTMFANTRSGTTVERPTSSMARYIGMPYFDTTLGFPVFLAIASSNVWVDATGAPA